MSRNIEQEFSTRAKKTVLVAEDEEMVRLVLSMGLEQMGLHVLQAADGVEAVELFRCHSVDLAILDCWMPHMDGYGALTELRRLNSTVPVVMISGDNESRVRSQFGDALPDEVLIKPFLCATLRETVLKWIDLADKPDGSVVVELESIEPGDVQESGFVMCEEVSR